MNLVERIKGILLQPKMEWAKIESERGDAGYLFSNYVAIVAAIPPICTWRLCRQLHYRFPRRHIRSTQES